MEKDPAALLYIDKWIAATQNMKGDSKGWFLDMILYQYDKGPLPNDVDELASICRIRPSEFDTFKQVFEQVLKQKFDKTPNGLLENKFAKEIIKGRQAFKNKRSNSGKWSYAKKFIKKHFGQKTEDELVFVYENFDFSIDLKNEQVFKQMLKHIFELYINEDENEDEVLNVEVVEPYGKSENYFHGPVPADLIEFANNLQPSILKADQWQKVLQVQIQSLGYQVAREVACPYANEDGELVEGFIDLQATKDGIAIGIELDNRVVTRDSWAKVHAYEIGMVLLRDPKPAAVELKVSLPAKPAMVMDSTFQDYEYWTADVIKGNDRYFNDMLMKESFAKTADVKTYAKSYLSLLAEYPKKAPPDQHRFRVALLGHMREKITSAKPVGNSKKQLNVDHID